MSHGTHDAHDAAGRALLLARTLPTLRPVQVVGRLLRAVRRPRPDAGAAPPRRAVRGPWTLPARRAPSLVSPTRFRLLGVERDVLGTGDWEAPGASRLWLYNLHYFDDLSAHGAAARAGWHRALVERWVRENPPGRGTGWDPYPTSLRLVAWMRWALGGVELAPAALHSLAVQARWLRANLELHLLGNHLLANAKALVFAGVFFEGPEARRWLEEGLALLRRELPEQVLADGGHFERSPMYHSLALEDLLDLVALARAFPGALPAEDVAGWRARSAGMRRWLACMTHPDGEIALLNDAAFGVAAAPAELERYARDLGLPPQPAPATGVEVLAESGYVRVALGEAVAFLDVGEIGPRYLPGHAHADTLGFELSLAGRRLVVDTGTSCYAEGPERSHQRSTRAHNTVEVDGADSSEVWASFRVARRAHPRRATVEERGGRVRVACAHDGYLRLPGAVLHRRAWTFAPDALAVADRLRGSWSTARGALHLHPDVVVDGERLHLEGVPEVRWRLEGAAARVEPSFWHPRFGAALPSRCLRYELLRPAALLRLSWSPCTSSS